MSASASSRQRGAIIIGGSMSGLFTAAFLRRIGWDVGVYERSAVELHLPVLLCDIFSIEADPMRPDISTSPARICRTPQQWLGPPITW
jgi:thioredoxin reductase